MMWADNYWIFSDDKEKLTWMVKDIIDELMDLDMELKPKSLWWTSPYKFEDEVTCLKWEAGRKAGRCRSSTYWTITFAGMGRAFR